MGGVIADFYTVARWFWLGTAINVSIIAGIIFWIIGP